MINSWVKKMAIPLSIPFLASCAWMTHYNNKETFGDRDAVFMDAKQRSLYAVTRTVEKKDNATVEDIFRGYCAEPSPDTMSALASSLGVDLNIKDEKKAAMSHSISEAVSNIGVRTAAIQALRDMMYRNCEAFALGGISPSGIETLQRRFQSTMVGLIAIEQLTGAVRAPQVSLSSSSSIGAADAIQSLSDKLITAQMSLDLAKKEKQQAKETLSTKTEAVSSIENDINANTAKVDELEKIENRTDPQNEELESLKSKNEELTKNHQTATEAKIVAQSSFDSVQQTTKIREDAYNSIDSSLRTARVSSGETNTQVTHQPSPPPQQLSDAAVQVVANAIQNIVKETINLSFYSEVCTTLVGLYPKDVPVAGSALGVCNALLLAADNPERQETVLKLYEGIPLDWDKVISDDGEKEIPDTESK